MKKLSEATLGKCQYKKSELKILGVKKKKQTNKREAWAVKVKLLGGTFVDTTFTVKENCPDATNKKQVT